MIPNLQLRNLLNLQNNQGNPNPNLINPDLLKDNFTDDQEKNILNFILAISIFLGALVSTLTYFNYQTKSELNTLNEKVENLIGVGKSKIQTKTEYETKISNLTKIKNIEN